MSDDHPGRSTVRLPDEDLSPPPEPGDDALGVWLVSPLVRSLCNYGKGDEAKGKIHLVKGQLKQEAGKLGQDGEVEAEGKIEKGAGVQQKIGQVEKVLGE